MTIFYMFLGLILLILINVPVAISLGIVGAVAIYFSYGALALPNIGMVMYDGTTSFPLIAIPLFILAGAIMNASSISRRLIDLASAMLGFIKGGLSMVTIGASIFFAEISGSAVAGVSAIGSIMIPAMTKKGYSKEFSAALSSSAASLAIILPPSIPMILYAVMSGESVVKMFVAGIFPGLLGALGLAGMCYYLARKNNFPSEGAFQTKRLWEAFKGAIWALSIPVIILGGIFGGVVTATEGAALAVVVAIFISAFVYREFTLRTFYKACLDAGVQTAVVMLLVASSAVVGLYLTETQLPQQLASSISEWTSNKYVHHLPDTGRVPALRCGDHPGRPDRTAAGACGGHRPDSFRSDRYAQPGNRPADSAGCQRAHRVLLDRPVRYLGHLAYQPVVPRRALRDSADQHLYPGVRPVAGESHLWRLSR